MLNPLIDKLKAMADKIDPQTDGIAILIVGDVQYEFGLTSTGNDEFHAVRLVDELHKAIVRYRAWRRVDATEVLGGGMDARAELDIGCSY